MNNIKPLLTQPPEYYLVGLAFLAGYTPPFSVDPLGIGLIVLLIFQITFKPQITGIMIASLFALSNNMVFALLSELAKFPAFNAGAINYYLQDHLSLS